MTITRNIKNPHIILLVDEFKNSDNALQNGHLSASISLEFIVKPERFDPQHKKQMNLRE